MVVRYGRRWFSLRISFAGAAPGSADDRPDKRFLPYGYDAEREKIRAEMMERASLVPDAKPSGEGEDQDYEMQPPPPLDEAVPAGVSGVPFHWIQDKAGIEELSHHLQEDRVKEIAIDLEHHS